MNVKLYLSGVLMILAAYMYTACLALEALTIEYQSIKVGALIVAFVASYFARNFWSEGKLIEEEKRRLKA